MTTHKQAQIKSRIEELEKRLPIIQEWILEEANKEVSDTLELEELNHLHTVFSKEISTLRSLFVTDM